jgi:hypothetical protein
MRADPDHVAGALQGLGDETAAAVLADNAAWLRSLPAADRLRLEAIAREIAARLLRDPVSCLEGAGPAQAVAVLELFRLDQAASATSPERRRTRVSA